MSCTEPTTIDDMLTEALDARLAAHPAPECVPDARCLLAHELTRAAVVARLNQGASVAGMLMVCADYFERECDADREADLLRAFARKFALVEAAGQ